MISTEQLLTSRDGFGIATASPAQRAACRIIDGEPLRELVGHPDVLQLVGAKDALLALPSERRLMPSEVIFLAAIRTAKTIAACAAAIRATQTVDVSKLGPGEVPRVSLVSLKLDTSAVAHGLLLETIKASRVLGPLLMGSTADTVTVKHPSGRAIEIACVAGAKAGAGLVARWSAGAIFDEAPRMAAAEDAVVNLSHARSAILGRLLPGAQAIYIGSPWAPHGPVYDLVEQHWKKPSHHMVVLRGTGPLLNPQWWTPERCTKLEEQDPIAHRTDVMGDFADPEQGLFLPTAIYKSTRERPLELPYENHGIYSAAVDPSEGSAKGNAFTLVIVQKQTAPGLVLSPCQYRPPPNHEPPKFKVALAREWRGFSPSQTWKQIAEACRAYGIRRVITDQYAATANVDIARMFGLHVRVEKATAASKLEQYTNLATLLHNDRIELSPDPVLRRDLLSVKRRITQGSAQIVTPRTGDGRHCDYAPALCAAINDAAHPKHVESRFIYVSGI